VDYSGVPVKYVLPAGTRFWRAHSASELSSSAKPLCVSSDKTTAVAEHCLTNVPFGPDGVRVVTQEALAGRVLTALTTTTDLTVAAVAAPTDRLPPDRVPPDVAWAQGLMWPSVVDVPNRTVALFPDRCPASMFAPAPAPTPLDDAAGTIMLTELLGPYHARVQPPVEELLVFVNYRSSDEKPAAHLLYETLRALLGDKAVFLDNRSIELGADFPETLRDSVRRCAVLVVIVGPRWEQGYDRHGVAALDRDDDWVRFEIAEAYRTGTVVMPVFVGRGDLKDAALPADIAQIAVAQGLSMAAGYDSRDVDLLAEKLISRTPRLDLARRARGWRPTE
jgi:hypothetical protein